METPRRAAADPRSDGSPSGGSSGAGGPAPGAAKAGSGARRARILLFVLLGVAASAAVAVAVGATGSGVLLPPMELDDGRARTLRMAAALAAVAGLVVLAVLRRRGRPAAGSRGSDPSVGGLLAATTLMGVLTLMALLAPPTGAGGGEGSGAGLPGSEGSTINPALPPSAAPPPPSATAPITRGAEMGGDEDLDEPDWRVREPSGQPARGGAGGFDWGLLGEVMRILLLVLLLAAGVVAVVGLRGRGAPAASEPVPDPARDAAVDGADAEAGLVTSLGQVAGEEGDPRRQITVAYRRLLAALAEAGAPRRPQEAPYEHLHRVLGPLGVAPGPVHRLTEMYVMAEFSEHPLTGKHRAEAADALEASLAGLRAARRRSSDAEVVGPAPGGRGMRRAAAT